MQRRLNPMLLALGLTVLPGCNRESLDDDGDGFTELTNDCDDSNPEVYPTADEVCDGIDNNCDAIIDDAASADAAPWYADGDGDGYGNPAASTTGWTASTRPCPRASRRYPITTSPNWSVPRSRP